MAQFNVIEWKLSNKEEIEDKQALSQGIHDLYISNAVYDDDTMIYKLTLHSLTTDEESTLTFFLRKKDGGDNKAAVNSLISLGHALQGRKIGIPFHESVIGGVVRAEVTLSDPKKTADGREVRYPSIYHFDAVSQDAVQIAVSLGWETIDQHVKEDSNDIGSGGSD